MDACDDLEALQRELQEPAQQFAVGQRAPAQPFGSHQQGTVTVAHVDAQTEGLGRRSKAEVVPHPHVHERRDVQCLCTGMPQRCTPTDCEVANWKQIGVSVSKGVVHLVEDRLQGAPGPVADVDTDGIEDVAKHAGHREEVHTPAIRIHPGSLEDSVNLTPEVIPAGKMILWSPGKEVRTAQREPAQPAGEAWHLFEVEQQGEHAVLEHMRCGTQSPVHDRAGINCTGWHASFLAPRFAPHRHLVSERFGHGTLRHRRQSRDRPDMDPPRLICDPPRATDTAKLFRHGQAGLKPILVEPGTKPRATEPCPAMALQRPQRGLGGDCRAVEDWVLVGHPRQDVLIGWHGVGVEGDKQVGAGLQRLETVHPVSGRQRRARGAVRGKIVPT